MCTKLMFGRGCPGVPVYEGIPIVFITIHGLMTQFVIVSFFCVPVHEDTTCLVCLLEHEKDRHLPFLDSNFSRRFQENLETSVYCKPTHTGKYHAFDSHHPIFYKKSVAKTFLRRADCLPSSLDLKADERKYVSNVLKANGYTKLISLLMVHLSCQE